MIGNWSAYSPKVAQFAMLRNHPSGADLQRKSGLTRHTQSQYRLYQSCFCCFDCTQLNYGDQLPFYDDKLKIIPPLDQIVTATAEVEGIKTKLEFEKKEDALVSKNPLPQGGCL